MKNAFNAWTLLFFLGFAETLLAVFGPFGQMEQDEIPGGKWYKFG